MTTIAHTISASFIAYLTISGANQPLNTTLVAASILPAALLDLDHLYYAIKNPQQFKIWQQTKQLHHARSIFHEVTGLSLIFALAIALSSVIDPLIVQTALLSYAIHVAQDIVMGTSKPLLGINNTQIQLFNFSFQQKIVADIATIALFGGLWILLLANLPG